MLMDAGLDFTMLHGEAGSVHTYVRSLLHTSRMEQRPSAAMAADAHETWLGGRGDFAAQVEHIMAKTTATSLNTEGTTPHRMCIRLRRVS